MSEEKKKIAKIVIDRAVCIGAASCLVAAGEVFELDAENKAVLKLKGGKRNSGPAEKKSLEEGTIDDETILAAAQACPTRAISLFDEDGNQIYP